VLYDRYLLSGVCIWVVLQPNCCTSLKEEWTKVDPAPEGIIDHLVRVLFSHYLMLKQLISSGLPLSSSNLS